MKSHSIIKLSLGAIAILAANCSQDDALIDSQADDNLQSYTLYLDADAPSFETVREGETRASGNSWEDGDVIYIAFSNGGNTVISNATYRSNLGAFQFSLSSLSSITDASCRVYYFRGGSVSVSYNWVHLDNYTDTAIFTDTSAKYTCSNNVISLIAAFKPYTWRLCFKGTIGSQIKLKSISYIVYNTSLNLTTGYFETKIEDVSLQVQSNGYTPYVYGQFIGTNNILRAEVGKNSYIRTILSSKLKIGQSGYFTIPTSSNLNGWTKESSGTIEHEFVDLGLPSGTLWAICNIGASSPEEFGDYFGWGEVEPKDCYDVASYTIDNAGSDGDFYPKMGYELAGTQYDVSYMKWGYQWRTPSYSQIWELRSKCTSEWTSLNGVYGRRFIGPNGNSIFLPAAGYQSGNYKDGGWSNNGYYWSSSAGSSHTDGYSYPSRLYFDSNGFGNGSWYEGTDYEGYPIRPICTKESLVDPDCPVAEAIDLGLPSGTKWASWNIGATKPEEYGGYYAWGETEEKDNYSWSTYTHCDGSDQNCHHIGNDIAGTEYDVAHVKWGGTWRMPSVDQFKELINNCTRSWTNQNGVNGILVTGPNGKTIFLPAAGSYTNYECYSSSRRGEYWSSSLYPNLVGRASFFYFGSDYWESGSYPRSTGQSVRAVCT